jgi:hypothetical protein
MGYVLTLKDQVHQLEAIHTLRDRMLFLLVLTPTLKGILPYLMRKVLTLKDGLRIPRVFTLTLKGTQQLLLVPTLTQKGGEQTQ